MIVSYNSAFDNRFAPFDCSLKSNSMLCKHLSQMLLYYVQA